MELKKFFHNKMINNGIALLLGAIIVSAFIMTMTYEPIVIMTYGFLFIVFSSFYQLIKSTVRKVRNQKYKLNKQWALFCATVLVSLAFLLVGYYNQETFFQTNMKLPFAFYHLNPS